MGRNKKGNLMKVLVIGSGGREHALVKSFFESPSISKVYACPGNPGIGKQAQLVSISLSNVLQIVQFCLQEKIDFVFIGPEDPLVDGLSDALREASIAVVGPSKAAAQLEGSKIFAKQFMQESGVATAEATIVNSVEQALHAAQKHQAPYVLKADGLAAGKGVFICRDLNELKTASDQLFNKKILGAAGEQALLEKNLPGEELSFLILTNGESYEVLPLAQDHKRLGDHNTGPNTGGMGTVAPLKISTDLYLKIITNIIEPSVLGLKNKKLLFRGVLFVGVMVVQNEPYALEYNVRLGDPETQVILPLIKNDIGQLFYQLALGKLEKISFYNRTAFCIVNAAPGYPNNVQKNISITLPANQNELYILHAGTQLNEHHQLVSSGGRVLNVIAINQNFEEAKKQAYLFNEQIIFKGRQFRKDLGCYQFQSNET